MDEKRMKKVRAAREKFAAYQKKKRERDKASSESVSLSDNSLSHEEARESDSSNISEHIASSIESVENDRSLHEIEITNILPMDDEDVRISQEDKPSSLSYDNSDSVDKVPSPGLEVTEDVRGILDDILKNEQFKSEGENVSKQSDRSVSFGDQSLDIFENLNLDDASLTNYLGRHSNCDKDISESRNNDINNSSVNLECSGSFGKGIRDMEDILTAKDSAIAALNAELELVRDVGSNQSTMSLGTSTTEYKQLHEEYQGKIVEFQNAIAHRDNLIEQLTESLQQSVINREELQRRSDNFAKQISELQDRLAESQRYEENMFSMTCLNVDGPCSLSELNLSNEVKCFISGYVQKKLAELRDSHEQEIKILRDTFESEKFEHESEVSKLRELLAEVECQAKGIDAIKAELDDKHRKEMEELRTYFEKKCSDLEKNYSEEIFSQQSRKMSGSSSSSEMASDLLGPSHPVPGPGGDAGSSDAKPNMETELYRREYEVGSSGEFEITEVIQSYERRLQEQVALAKMDIIAALEAQIQRLAESDIDEEEWPSELLQLRRRFAERYETQLAEMQRQHQREMSQLKEEHQKTLARARRRSSSDSLNESDLIKDRDSLKKSNTVLRNLVSELVKYFGRCEDELNNTLVDELVKNGFDRSLTQIENELMLEDSKRVHFTPNLDFSSILENSALSSLDSMDVKNELQSCLEKLRSDANAILALTTNLQRKEEPQVDEKVSSLCTQLEETKKYVQGLESERDQLENHSEMLLEKQKVMEEDLCKAKSKIAELVDNGRKEVVSQGYGENPGTRESILGGRINSMAELQERARTVATQCGAEADHPLLQLVDDLCQEGDRIVDDAKKEHMDLLQQIEAADKKYKATCQFLEEQASEREQERDEAQREIAALKEQLREREKDRASCERVNNEVEQLEHQMREMQKLIDDNELKYLEVDKERKEAVEKICFLRDIIRDLEAQIETKAAVENELRNIVVELEGVVRHQTKSNIELNQQLDSVKDVPSVRHFEEHIARLEEELQRLRVNNELAGSEGAFKKIKLQLSEFETTIDKRTQELEALHSSISATTCSSPSEDMSIRDQIRPHTPAGFEECEIPLQQLARLKEKLMRHARAEDAAVKRIRDLDMQVVGMRHDLEELQNERDALQDQVTEQLVLISNLQIRLDEQRLLAEDVQKQTNTSLEVRIYDLENEVQQLRETLHSKEKNIKQLTNTLEHTKKRLEDRERQLNSEEEDEVVMKLQKQIQELKQQNANLEAKVKDNVHNTKFLPGLVDNIIADKNADIERLRDQLSDTQRQLEAFLSLNLDRDQLISLSQLKSSERALGDMMTLIDCQSRRAENKEESMISNIGICTKSNPNDTVPPANNTTEISGIDPIRPPQVVNSTEISHKRVHFEDMEQLQAENAELRHVLNLKDEEYTQRLNSLKGVEEKVERLQKALEKTEEALKLATEKFEKEQQALRIELAEKKVKLTEKEQQLQVYEEDSLRKDQMYINLAKEKRELEKRLQEIAEHEETRKNYESIITQKNKEINSLEEQILELSEAETKMKLMEEQFSKQLREKEEVNSKLKKELENNEIQLRHLDEELKKAREEQKKLQNLVVDRETEIEILNEDSKRYQDDLASLEKQLKDTVSDGSTQQRVVQLQRELAERNQQVVAFQREISDLLKIKTEKDKIIEQMAKDSRSLQTNLETIQSKMQESGNILDLQNRLKSEQKKKEELQEEVQNLRVMLLAYQNGKQAKEMAMTVEEVTRQVGEELECSARIDSNILQALGGDEEERLKNEIRELRQNEDVLKSKLEAAVEAIAQLQNLLEEEKRNSNHVQIEDARLIEQMRIRLDSALDNENEFEKMLEAEKSVRRDLEQQLAALKQKIQSVGSPSSSKIDLTEYKSLPNAEISKLKKQIESLEEENSKMKSNLKALKREMGEKNNNLKYNKDMLDLKNEEIKKLNERIEDLKKDKERVKAEVAETKSELEKRSNEVENARALIDEMEYEHQNLKAQIRELRNQQPPESTDPSNRLLPEKMMKKMKELKNLLKDNRQLEETLHRLNTERQYLQRRVAELEQRHEDRLPIDDMEARANHLFARYLHSDSQRKALVWQKRYLISLLATYQAAAPVAHLEVYDPKTRAKKSSGSTRFRAVAFVVIAVQRLQFIARRWHSGVRSISHINLRYKTRKVDVDFRVGGPVSNAYFGQKPPHYVCGSLVRAGNRAVEHYSDPQNFTGRENGENGQYEASLLSESLPWSGRSPPSKDIGSKGEKKWSNKGKMTQQSTNGEFEKLATPDIVSQYIDRFNKIQNRLGVVLNTKLT